jgi:hypothetical protein
VIYNRFNLGSGVGIQDRHVMREGLNFVVPWVQRPVIFDIRTRPKLINSTSGSKGTINQTFFPFHLLIYMIEYHRFTNG